MKLSTDAIDSRGFFDPRYTCDADNSSPELRWEEVPPGAVGFVVIAEDLDHPQTTFAHWVIYDIPARLSHLPAGIPPQDTLPNGIKQGLNNFHKLGYAGPCPPSSDPPHRYAFRIFALRSALGLPPRASRESVVSSMEGLILASAEVIGQYQRSAERAAG